MIFGTLHMLEKYNVIDNEKESERKKEREKEETQTREFGSTNLTLDV